MDTLFRDILWRQYGAAFDHLDGALAACPDELWLAPGWSAPDVPAVRAQFWYVAYHALFWTDVYLFGTEESFAPPAPFALTEQEDINGPLPSRAYTKTELRGYLADLRQRYHYVIAGLSDERAHQPVEFGWMEPGATVTYAEVQLYSMRHLQGHAVGLWLLLRQHGIPPEDWVTRVS